MNVRRLRILCVEIHKIITNLLSDFKKKNFALKETRQQYKLNLEIPQYNKVTFGGQGSQVFGFEVWYCLQHHTKFSEKKVMKTRKVHFTNAPVHFRHKLHCLLLSSK